MREQLYELSGSSNESSVFHALQYHIMSRYDRFMVTLFPRLTSFSSDSCLQFRCVFVKTCFGNLNLIALFHVHKNAITARDCYLLLESFLSGLKFRHI